MNTADPIANVLADVEGTLALVDTNHAVGRRYVSAMNRDIANLRSALGEIAVAERRARLDDAHDIVLVTIAITSGDFGRYVRLFGVEGLPNLRG
jgi:hypothetical protein